ncbi:MAG: ROK family protein [candidate division KSB1 bacterium]|nr:ROK family protein [candidate division KSB1 bacterium]MDZ7368133.1 ROK family protein [candidate division KSB1 bacterium]MDZ7405811.1 ROK family protein [candidate division KSB1 bacterium]
MKKKYIIRQAVADTNYYMNDSDDSILGLDIGGTKTAVVLGSQSGEVRWRKQFSTRPERGFAIVFGELVNTVEEALEATKGNVMAISIAIGGPLDVLRGIIKSPPNLPGWVNVPLKELLTERFALPVYVEHDGNAGALAEFYFGAGKGCQNIIFITMGTGFGAGLILNGQLYRGTSDAAGEIGHIRIAEDGPWCYGKAGSLEGFGSGPGIAKLAQIMYPEIWNASATVIEVHNAYQHGSKEARVVLERAGFYLGRGLAIIADTLNPERIILGGIGMRLGEALLTPARRVFESEALPQTAEVCEIVPAQLGEAIGDVAALCAAYDQGKLLKV